MNDKSIFSKRLTQQRIKENYTQETFSAKIGMSRARYANYEQSRREPDFDIVKLFADHLKCTTDYLLNRTDNPNVIFIPAKNNGVSDEDLELLRKIKKLPSDKREIVDAVIKVSEASDSENEDAAAGEK
jgi:transcriptional regulator with XRE-family HTH domain